MPRKAWFFPDSFCRTSSNRAPRARTHTNGCRRMPWPPGNPKPAFRTASLPMPTSANSSTSKRSRTPSTCIASCARWTPSSCASSGPSPPSRSKPQVPAACGNLLHSLNVARLGSIHLDLVTVPHKRRNVDDQSSLELSRLHHRAGRRLLNALLRLHHRQIHRIRQQHANRLVVVILNFHGQIRNQVIPGVAHNIVLQRQLLVILRVHEVVRIPVAVQILELDFVHHHFFQRFFRAEPEVHHVPVAQVAHLGLHRTALISRRAVVHAIHDAQVALVLDDHSRA